MVDIFLFFLYLKFLKIIFQNIENFWRITKGEFVDSDWLEGNGKTSRDVNEDV